jgi:hypothetical protein
MRSKPDMLLSSITLLQVAPTFGRVGGFLRSIEEEMNNMLQVGNDPEHGQSKQVCCACAVLLK